MKKVFVVLLIALPLMVLFINERTSLLTFSEVYGWEFNFNLYLDNFKDFVKVGDVFNILKRYEKFIDVINTSSFANTMKSLLNVTIFIVNLLVISPFSVSVYIVYGLLVAIGIDTSSIMESMSSLIGWVIPYV